ncbi:unnamed protein product, partial [Nesidiocoris tenuis]
MKRKKPWLRRRSKLLRRCPRPSCLRKLFPPSGRRGPKPSTASRAAKPRAKQQLPPPLQLPKDRAPSNPKTSRPIRTMKKTTKK